MPFHEGQEVRVRALLQSRFWEHAHARAGRPPAVGDVGGIIDFDGSGGTMIYAVEWVHDGAERWLTEFEEQELEPLPPP